jgi:DNA-directed RNA polymerase specialized sigma24 family protein
MARDPQIEARLQRWAQWLTAGDGSGYPVKSTLHEDWSPPSPGMTPTMKTVKGSDGPQTQRMVSGLSDRRRATLVAVYVLRMPIADAAAALDCAPDTVLDRVERIHRQLLGLIGEAREFCNIQRTG